MRAFALLAAALLCAAPLQAQQVYDPPVRVNMVSILPLHFLGGFYAGDYERALSRSVSVGAGASYFKRSGTVETDPFTSEQFHSDRFTYRTVEGKVRFYPSGDVLNGLSFGVTAGPTFVSGNDVSPTGGDSFTAMGVGFELARSHTMGEDSRFYYGIGGGGKRLFPVGGESGNAVLVLPTLRLSVGLLF
ncbi:MAG: hypothetical protein AVDCRST_MAG68-172 [uncultured Gemmatimonadetes bacterium]|uniref:Outer membrane protein beta-barrel domain-containing protein n=1 Tax=uncultured Gemmatimonadota bacterium TaxID=203437 RepID=A0A6J4K978_9BACT|nr:MAG: hypothetical protein AVDCRST_MAG68-172 [uncultured Gemmatimonadota bacterium]